MKFTPSCKTEPIPEIALEALQQMLGSGDLFRYHASSDAPVTLLEQEFAELMGAKYALALNSCSSALFVSLRALDLVEGAKVLIPAFTFAAVPSAVVHAGYTPVLAEIGEDLRLDMADFTAKLDQVQAVIVSHMRGHTSDMDAIMAACEKRGIPVVEDAAHSLGTTWAGEKIGTMGCVGCFSFQSYKLVNGGEGGILITDDADIAARCVTMSGAYESNWKKHGAAADGLGAYQNKLPLYNLRMSNLAAAVIRPQLPEVEQRAAQGLRNHDALAAVLNGHPKCFRFLPVYRRNTGHRTVFSFAMSGLSEPQITSFVRIANEAGLGVGVFGAQPGNARAFWNWEFSGKPSRIAANPRSV